MQGWKYNHECQKWGRLELQTRNTDSPPFFISGPLRVATINVLHDKSLPRVLFHEIRYETICSELRSLDADIIGLNEVTPTLLKRILEEEWVKNHYTVSAVLNDSSCKDLAAVRGGSDFGNLLLSRIPPLAIEHIPIPNLQRESHVATFSLTSEKCGHPIRLGVASVHLTALPWFNESKRKNELQSIATSLVDSNRGFESCIVMGDFNFHREAENSSIPHDFYEAPVVISLGATWDYTRNTMLPKMLPACNFYNGFGTGWGWPPSLRLDRMLLYGGGLDKEAVQARLFANRPVRELQGNLREGGKNDVWQEYLYPSDHYGLICEIPFCIPPIKS